MLPGNKTAQRGKLIYIGFNEHRRIGLKYIVRVDSSTEIYGMHDLSGEDFEEWCKEEGLDISKCTPS